MVHLDQEENRVKRWMFGFIPVVLLMFFIFLMSSYFASVYYVMSPRLAMNEWSCNGRIDNLKTWDSELAKLQIAQKLDPWSADILLDIGRMFEWKALSEAAWNSSAREARTEASNYYKRAIKYRPTWALAWANYAQSQLLNRVVNEEVYTALSNGFKFGRWQTDSQQKLLWLSIGIWENLPSKIQQQVRDHIRATQNKKDAMSMFTKIAVRFQWFDELMPLLDSEKNRRYVNSIRDDPKKMRNILKNDSQQQEFVCRVSEI